VHEERLDIPALRAGIEGGAFFVGALGSRRTQAKRREKLGALADQVRGPVGLDLGGVTPAEIALEILAEMLQAHRKGEARVGTLPDETLPDDTLPEEPLVAGR
jgi:xanthine dehydrogenase accessory factor